MSVFRIYVEKKPEFAVEAKNLLADIKTALRLEKLRNLRILNRYDAEGLSEEDFRRLDRCARGVEIKRAGACVDLAVRAVELVAEKDFSVRDGVGSQVDQDSAAVDDLAFTHFYTADAI